jgi:hypothetical protein
VIGEALPLLDADDSPLLAAPGAGSGRPRVRRSCFTQSTSIVHDGTVMGAGVILAKFNTANIGSGNASPCPTLR